MTLDQLREKAENVIRASVTRDYALQTQTRREFRDEFTAEVALALVERIEEIVKDINEERLHLGFPVAPQEAHDRIVKEVVASEREANEQEVLAAANGHAEEPVKPTKRVRGRRK